jgi:hypothetical protein
MFDKKVPAEAQVLMDEGPGQGAGKAAPQPGDTVKVNYDSKHHKAEIQLDGDPHYDPKLIRARQQQSRDAEDRALLNGAPAAAAAPHTAGDDGPGPENYGRAAVSPAAGRRHGRGWCRAPLCAAARP